MDTLDWRHVAQQLSELFPNYSIGTDNDGQYIIYTDEYKEGITE